MEPLGAFAQRPDGALWEKNVSGQGEALLTDRATLVEPV